MGLLCVLGKIKLVSNYWEILEHAKEWPGPHMPLRNKMKLPSLMYKHNNASGSLIKYKANSKCLIGNLCLDAEHHYT